jgi:Methylase involved in ubiquinone/menaquinone biosynthesis
MNTENSFDALFAGIIGQEYEILKQICPPATEMSRLVGEEVAAFCHAHPGMQTLVELGSGTGITTLSILSAHEGVKVLSIDNEPVMQEQAKNNLQDWVLAGRLDFSANDALSALKALPDDSVNIVASAYTLHNFEKGYRQEVIAEIYRVLKPDGRFINGDRYAFDDMVLHTRNTQQEVAGYFKVLTEMGRPDLLEQWILHLFSDESEARIMRESASLAELKDAGFQHVQLKSRLEVNAVMTAVKC